MLCPVFLQLPWVGAGSQPLALGRFLSSAVTPHLSRLPWDPAGQLCPRLCTPELLQPQPGVAQSSSHREGISVSRSSLLFSCALFLLEQFKDHKGVSEEPAVALDSVFATLLRSAYERGSSALLEEAVQSKLRDLAARLPPEQLLLGVKHVLLYLKSTVESFSRVRAMLEHYSGYPWVILRKKVQMTWLLKNFCSSF